LKAGLNPVIYAKAIFYFQADFRHRLIYPLANTPGLDSKAYGTHTMRRTKATLIYRRTKNLRAVQLLLGHSKLDSTVRYLAIEIDDALEISEQIDV